MRKGLVWCLVLVLAISCIDEKDYKLTSIEVNPAMAFPLAEGDLSIIDVLKKSDSAYVKIDGNDQVYLDYQQLLLSTDVRSLFDIPDKIVIQDIPLASGNIPPHANDIRKDSLVETVDLGLSPEKLTEIDFKSGTITYTASVVPANPNLGFEVILTSSDLASKSTGHTFSVTTPPSGKVDLSDYKLALSNNKFNLKMVVVLTHSSSTVHIAPNTSVHIDFRMETMDFNVIKGFLGDRNIPVPSATLLIGAFGSSLKDATVTFAQANVSLDVANSCGVPSKLNFLKFQSEKTGSFVAAVLNPANPVTIGYPAVIGGTANTQIVATNAKQMMDIGPTQVVYQFDTHINQGLSSGNNFLTDTSKIQATLHVTVPLAGKASNMILWDTTNIDLSKIDQSEVQSASLKVHVNNEMPLAGAMQFYLPNESSLDSLLSEGQTDLIPPSTVTSGGDLETAGQYDAMLPLNTDQLNKIFTAKKLILKVKLNTAKDDGGNVVDVNFKSKYRININLGLLATLHFIVEK